MCASGARKLQLSGSESCSFGKLHTRLLEARLRIAAPAGLGNVVGSLASQGALLVGPKGAPLLKGGRLGRKTSAKVCGQTEKKGTAVGVIFSG